MAGLIVEYQSPVIALDPGVKTTMVQILMPTHQRGKVLEWEVSFEGDTNTDEPAKCELERQTTAGSGGVALTGVLADKDISETPQSAGLYGIEQSSSGPTQGDVLRRIYVHPQGGHTWQAPFGREYVIPGGERVGLAITVQNAVNAMATLRIEE